MTDHRTGMTVHILTARNQRHCRKRLSDQQCNSIALNTYCRKSWPSAGIAIPHRVSAPERSAALADAMNDLSHDIVWPVYRGLVLEQKNLRNEESIEMLDIILRSGIPSLNSGKTEPAAMSINQSKTAQRTTLQSPVGGYIYAQSAAKII